MKENNDEITYERLEAFLEEMASATVKPIPIEKTGEMTLRTNIENAKREIQKYRELIAATKNKILAWEIELEKVRRGY